MSLPRPLKHGVALGLGGEDFPLSAMVSGQEQTCADPKYEIRSQKGGRWLVQRGMSKLGVQEWRAVEGQNPYLGSIDAKARYPWLVGIVCFHVL